MTGGFTPRVTRSAAKDRHSAGRFGAVTVDTYRNDPLYPRIVRAVGAILAGEVEPKAVRSRLAGLPGAGLAFERSPDPQRPGIDNLALSADDVDESSRSYHLFFIAPAAPWARLDVEDERPVDFAEGLGKHGEEGRERVRGCQQVGCAVSVSVLAPVGFVRLDAMTTYEDGACEEPDPQPKIFDLDFKLFLRSAITRVYSVRAC
jgi:hypothetical protein